MSDHGDNKDIPSIRRIGVIVELRESANPWAEGTWRSVEVLADAPEDNAWKRIGQSEGWQRYYAGSLELELFKRETEAYKVNLSQPAPAVYVVLRPGEGDEEPDVVPFLVTFSPYEAEDYTESGDMFVDAVPMPESLIAWASKFVETFHVDQPFKKRKQKRKSDSATGRGGPDRFARSRDGR